jgi:hypothetical protein
MKRKEEEAVAVEKRTKEKRREEQRRPTHVCDSIYDCSFIY